MKKATAADSRPLKTKEVEAELTRFVRGEVRFDNGSRALYATGGSNYRQVPIGVVVPRDIKDVEETLRICHAHQAPVLARGGGTSLAGQCCNVAVVMDMSKYMNRVLSLDPEKRIARVQPGTILDDLRNEAERHHLTFGPDPSTHNHCTLGGMIGNNSCGVHAQMAGRTSDNIHSLDILTYDGVRMTVGKTSEWELERIIRSGAPGNRRSEIYRGLKNLRDKYADLIRQRFPKIPRRVSGYNLDELLPENGFNVARALVGSEGTCVTVVEATTHLVHSPPYRSLVLLGYSSVYEAGDHVPQINEFHPIGLEGMDDILVRDMTNKGLHPEVKSLLPEGKGWLLVEFGGENKAEADARAREMMSALKAQRNAPSMRLFEDKEEERKVWTIREAGLGATARAPGTKDTWEGWEDSAVPPEKLGTYLRELRELFNKYDYGCALYGHFGQACVHTRIDFDLLTAPGIKKYRSFMDEATDLVVRLGGSLSGEHGDGQSKAEFLPKMFGPQLIEAFREFKTIWDPDWKMNPGKVVDPYLIDQNLRLGPNYNPPEVTTHFRFPEDKGNMPYATLRCVGVGECRRMEGGTMCPSFRVTREEEHSTRGRAHLLHEMLRGDSPVHEGWRSEAVRGALDLCLACKGCKSDCPMNVDMATYKAEFLSHYYAGRVRPITAYSMGLINIWSEIASKMPRVANFLTQTPFFSRLAKALAGIAPQRQIPKFAEKTFKSWFKERGPRGVDATPVILWADTFNNYFHPETAMAAVEVLEAAGYRVIVPSLALCCGRPLYDFGMLDLAKAYLNKILANLGPLLRAGVPVVGLEPSCVSVFRDELRNLIPDDQDAQKLSQQTFILSEFIEKNKDRFQLPEMKKDALVQGHCHHKSVLKFDPEKKVLERMGLGVQVIDEGCCGMAGSFGFEKANRHYEVSMQIGERGLFKKIRESPGDSLVVANGFSCREQIQQATGRRAYHIAQIIQMGMRLQRGQNMNKETRLFDVVESYEKSLQMSRSRRDRPRARRHRASLAGGAAAIALGVSAAAILRKVSRS